MLIFVGFLDKVSKIPAVLRIGRLFFRILVQVHQCTGMTETKLLKSVKW